MTYGELHVSKIEQLSHFDKQHCFNIAASIEKFSEHPVAKGILTSHDGSHLMPTREVKSYPGEGVCGVIDGSQYFIGNVGFIRRMTNHFCQKNNDNIEEDKCVFLADKDSLHCVFYLRDTLREDARALIRDIKNHGKSSALLSGDDLDLVKKTASELEVDYYWGAQLPEEKLQRLRELKSRGNIVAMVGDGINDAPVMASAHLSIAVDNGTDLAKSQADMIVLNEQLSVISKAINISQSTMRVIKQNISWAIIYNLTALPLAALGYVPPWLAAIGMSLSSLIVVSNSARLSRL